MLCSAKAAYKKSPGFLELAPTHLQWTPDGKSAPTVRVSATDLLALFCSKEGAAQVRLKVSLVGDDTGHNFTFISPQPTSVTERENFKAHLTSILARNRDGPMNPPAAAFAVPQVSNPSTPRPGLPLPTASSSRDGSMGPPGDATAADYQLRKRVLMSNPELARLHRELVPTGQITEAEFWDGRQAMLLAQAADNSQKRGRPGQLVDPRPQSVQGENKFLITPQLVHDIFEEYPVVAQAYSDNVPTKLSEGEFWKRYFQSKLFNAHRASIRSTAAQHVMKDDPIFDKYLQKIDDELEPRRQRDGAVGLFVDLHATQEDHGETGNENDITMRAGRNRGALPLIRKFNEHSERLLNSALGDQPPAKKRRTDDGEATYSQIDLDDLHDPESSAGIVLEMQDSQRYTDGRMAVGEDNSETVVATKTADAGLALFEAKDSIRGWNENLSQLKIERKSGDTALLSMTQNVAERLEVKTRKNEIPEGLFNQMKTCQTAANEFLRQFWSSMFPPAGDVQTLAAPTPAQKAAKAAKMVSYLSKTHEKVEALIHAGAREGVDHTRIQVAMKPVLNSVDKALAFHRSKLAAGPVRKG